MGITSSLLVAGFTQTDDAAPVTALGVNYSESRDKHGGDFAEVVEFFEWATAVIEPSPRGDEMRWRAIGYMGERLHIVIYTMRGSNTRIISLRKANTREERRYDQAH